MINLKGLNYFLGVDGAAQAHRVGDTGGHGVCISGRCGRCSLSYFIQIKIPHTR